MLVISSFDYNLEKSHLEQYEALLEEAKSEAFFYGTPLDNMVDRQLVIVDDRVIGCFEHGKITFEGKSYFRTNRPYTKKEFRGKGYMLEALKFWYMDRRPAMSWIDDENISSIRLFQNLGFRQGKAFFHKNKDGHFYFLTHDA